MKTYKKIFALNSEENLIKAVRNGMNVYLRNYSEERLCGDKYETFFEAAVRYGTPALVHACIDMGADMNCVAPIKARYISPRAVTSSLSAAMEAYNPGTLRALLERGARLGVLNGLLWGTQKNLIPEAEYDDDAKKIKQRLDAGTEILKILREFGYAVPGLSDDSTMSFYRVHPLYTSGWYKDGTEEAAGEKYTAWDNWYGMYAEDGGDADEDECEENSDTYCEGLEEFMWEYSFPCHGTRPGALWHAASPEALKLMIASGADVNAMGANARDAAGWTAMHHIACHLRSGYYFSPNAMIQILSDAGADVNAIGRYGMTPMMLTAMHVKRYVRALETVKLLARNGADFDIKDKHERTALWWMDERQRSLVTHEVKRPLLREIFFEIRRSALNSSQSATLDLMAGVFCRTVEGIAPIVERGADLNARTEHGYTPLMFASVYNVAETVKFLIEKGADPNARNAEGDSPLALAALEKNTSVITTLLEAGAAPTSVSSAVSEDKSSLDNDDFIKKAIAKGIVKDQEGKAKNKTAEAYMRQFGLEV